MILIMDYSSVCVSTLLATIGKYTNVEITENMIRHMILNTIRSNVKKFSGASEIVIACDSPSTWRRDFFPLYKQARRNKRKTDELNWKQIFDMMNKVANELKEFFPYTVVSVEGCEADDIIGVIANYVQDEVVILSGDKDFLQLQVKSNIRQYDPVRKRWVVCDNPANYLFEHIVRGDASDGIPNIFMDTDHFITGIGRQKPVTKKKLEQLRLMYDEGDLGEFEDRFIFNRELIDLSRTPSKLKNEIIATFENERLREPTKSFFNYLADHKLSELWSKANDFYPRGVKEAC